MVLSRVDVLLCAVAGWATIKIPAVAGAHMNTHIKKCRTLSPMMISVQTFVGLQRVAF
jgi:hypothetical protein